MSGQAPRRVFLSLGSNQGNRSGYLAAGRAALAALPGTRLVAASRAFETEPQDFAQQPAFLNQVVCLETELAPRDLLSAAQHIESAEGRVRALRFGPRTLDIDILLFEGVESADGALVLPHPRLTQRAFVLVPLLEVWEWARGMPAFDVASLARTTAASQSVRPWESSEASR